MKLTKALKLKMMKVPPSQISKAIRELDQSGVTISEDDLAAYYLTTNGELDNLIGIVRVFAEHKMPIDAGTATSISTIETVETIRKKFSTEQGRVDWVQYWYEEHNPSKSALPS